MTGSISQMSGLQMSRGIDRSTYFANWRTHVSTKNSMGRVDRGPLHTFAKSIICAPARAVTRSADILVERKSNGCARWRYPECHSSTGAGAETHAGDDYGAAPAATWPGK